MQRRVEDINRNKEQGQVEGWLPRSGGSRERAVMFTGDRASVGGMEKLWKWTAVMAAEQCECA